MNEKLVKTICCTPVDLTYLLVRHTVNNDDDMSTPVVTAGHRPVTHLIRGIPILQLDGVGLMLRRANLGMEQVPKLKGYPSRLRKVWRRTCSPGDPTPQRQCAWLLSTYLKEGEEQKEVLEAKDDEEKESQVDGEVEEREREERVAQRVHET